MDKYITDKFLKMLDEASKDEKKALRRKKAIEIFEGEKGKLLPNKIAEMLGISETQVMRYLGETRIKKYKNLENVTVPKRRVKASKTERQSS